MKGSMPAFGRAGAVAALVGLLLSSCAPKTPPPVVPGAPSFPDFVFPTVPPAVGEPDLASSHQRAWALLQAGDVRGAGREYASLVRRSPGFYPAEAGFGYVRLAEQQYADALARFDRVLALAPLYAPALAGKGEGLLATGQRDLALASFEAALKADPGLPDLPRRIDVLRFERVRELVDEGKKAADAGRYDEARRAYGEAVLASPQSGFLYRELGLVEMRLGANSDAAANLNKAASLDPSDVRALTALAEALDRTGDLLGAVDALERAYAADPSEDARAALARARDRSETAALPPDFRAIPTSAQITRGDLAALLGVRLQPLIARSRQRSAVVATDVRGHWAATWIMSVTRAGIMDVYPNHTFQPRAGVRRADLALVVSRVLAAEGSAAQPPGRQRVPIADVGPDHLSYPAVSAAVASGVMPLADGRLFRPTRAVSGAEAIEVIGRLERLVRAGRQD